MSQRFLVYVLIFKSFKANQGKFMKLGFLNIDFIVFKGILNYALVHTCYRQVKHETLNFYAKLIARTRK